MVTRHVIQKSFWPTSLRPNQSSIQFGQRGTANGSAGGDKLPVEIIKAGDIYEVEVTIPRGVTGLNWYCEFNNYLAMFSVNGGKEESYPVAVSTQEGETVTLRVRALQDILLMSFSINFHINPDVYSGSAPIQSKADIVLELVRSTGLFESLQKFTGLKDQEFVDKAISSGTWESILKFYDEVNE